MAAHFDPHDIGQTKAPEINETVPYLKDTDQRWFSQMEALYPSKKKQPWDGSGYMPEQQIRKLASRYLWAATVDRLVERFLKAQ